MEFGKDIKHGRGGAMLIDLLLLERLIITNEKLLPFLL